MSPRQNADLRNNLAHRFGIAAVDTQAGVEDGVADDVGFEVVQDVLGGTRVQTLDFEDGEHGFLGGADFLVAGLLDLLLVGFGGRVR